MELDIRGTLYRSDSKRLTLFVGSIKPRHHYCVATICSFSLDVVVIESKNVMNNLNIWPMSTT